MDILLALAAFAQLLITLTKNVSILALRYSRYLVVVITLIWAAIGENKVLPMIFTALAIGFVLYSSKYEKLYIAFTTLSSLIVSLGVDALIIGGIFTVLEATLFKFLANQFTMLLLGGVIGYKLVMYSLGVQSEQRLSSSFDFEEGKTFINPFVERILCSFLYGNCVMIIFIMVVMCLGALEVDYDRLPAIINNVIGPLFLVVLYLGSIGLAYVTDFTMPVIPLKEEYYETEED